MEEIALDEVDGAASIEHRALIGSVDDLIVTLVQLDSFPDVELEVEIRRGRELVTMAPDPVQLRVLAGFLDRAAAALGG